MRKGTWAFLLLFCLVCTCITVHAAAAEQKFYFEAMETELAGGEQVRLLLTADSSEQPAAGFRASVEYDDTRFRFVRAEVSSQIKSKTLRVAEDRNPVRAVYVCDTQGGGAPELSGEILCFVFEAKEGAPEGTGKLSACVDQICGWDSPVDPAVYRDDFSIPILPAASGVARLTALAPSHGVLNPSFSPDILEYDLEVGAEVTEVLFEADAQEGGTVRISRRTLNRAGTSTDIRAAVTSENGRNRVQYTVHVNRAEKEQNPDPEPAPGEALLSRLIPSAGELSPAFSPDITNYMLNVESEISSVTFETESPGGEVSVSRHMLYRAGSSTNILITVTSADQKWKRVYTVTVNRAAQEQKPDPSPAPQEILLSRLIPSAGELSPAFSPEITDYILHVESEISSVTFEAESPGGQVSVNRHTLYRAGSSTKIIITATSADKKVKKVYTVTVYRDEKPAEPEVSRADREARLQLLEPSSGALFPPFDPAVTEYDLTVGAGVDEVTFRAAADDGGTVRINRRKLNRAGENTEIQITALSADGKDRLAYTVTVIRLEEAADGARGGEARLTALVPSEGELSPPFAPDIMEYRIAVSAACSDLILRADAQEGAFAAVSRHKLNKAGETTAIQVTVASSQGKKGCIYTVLVDRAANEGYVPKSAASTAGPGPSRPPTVKGKDRTARDEETAQPAETAQEGQAAQNAGMAAQAGTRTLYMAADQMPAFLAGAFSTAACVFLGMFLQSRKRSGNGKP